MKTMNRREFLKLGSASLALLALPPAPQFANPLNPDAPPAPLGRIATWWRQAVRTAPSPTAEIVAWKTRDEVIPLHAAVVGEAPWPSNPVWYQTDGNYIHSGYVQPVDNQPQGEVITEVAEPGFWSQVCVPIAEARWSPASAYVNRKLYHGTVYRVVRATVDDEGNWWYQLQDGVTYSPGPYVPTWSVRRIPPDQLTPISPGRADKWMQINIDEQTLTCFEGDGAVFSTRIASGVYGLGTPLGEFRVLYQRHTQRMIGGGENDYYDLPGVAFPVYFTWSGVAIHGTYWHNDYGRRHSHGCVNVTNAAAQWIFRWADPAVPYTDHTLRSGPDEGTRVVVV
jgi:lipoprotein-anchoring transpeptidase ErfK/SrfK